MRISILLTLLIGCGDKESESGHVHEADADTDADTDADSDAYAFTSAFESGASSVSYSGQIFRQVLIGDMKTHLGGMTERINTGWYPEPGEVAAELDFYFDFDGDTSGEIPHAISTSPAALQTTYNDIASGKNLVGKLAGNDKTGQHTDWSTDFVGWEVDGVTTPQSLVELWFAQIDAQAVAFSIGDYPLAPDGTPVEAITITPQGQDLRQLLEKFLRGAVSFSQGTDDYLDDDTEGKGLLADHTGSDDGAAYTALEHAWDEGFGYFGAAQTYGTWSDDDIADTEAIDTNADGSIDLLSEVCWGHSVNTAKRDRGSAEAAPNDFTAAAWSGFHSGRTLLSSTAGAALTDAEFAELQGHRDEAVGAWEDAIASTVVHYINDTLADMSTMDTDDYSFTDHAKHWSELKGFALSMQFNPRSWEPPRCWRTLIRLHGPPTQTI